MSQTRSSGLCLGVISWSIIIISMEYKMMMMICVTCLMIRDDVAANLPPLGRVMMSEVLDVRVAHDQRNTLALLRNGQVTPDCYHDQAEIVENAGELAVEGEGWPAAQLAGQHQGEHI